jgi:hypothetical protein
MCPSKKLSEIKGWLEVNEKQPIKNYPIKCKYCGSKMNITNSLQYCNIFMVWCPNSKCRWCLIFEE